ncbi:MAG: hypothetical protein OJI67_06290 [Prosthecobacter sp.]|nr:hypothetical protein [Prosthecobacter sp.]
MREDLPLKIMLVLKLTPELEEQASTIPDLQDRMLGFIQHQVDLEAWRAKRSSSEARSLVQEAFEEGRKMKAKGITRDQAFIMLGQVHQRISQQL